MDLTFVLDRVGDDEFPEVEDVAGAAWGVRRVGVESNGIGLRLAGSRITFNRRDPSRIYNAVFASSNRSGLILRLLLWVPGSRPNRVRYSLSRRTKVGTHDGCVGLSDGILRDIIVWE